MAVISNDCDTKAGHSSVFFHTGSAQFTRVGLETSWTAAAVEAYVIEHKAYPCSHLRRTTVYMYIGHHSALLPLQPPPFPQRITTLLTCKLWKAY